MNFFDKVSSRTFRFWRSRGFTQVEILIIVLVIGILAAIALPSFGGMLDAAKMRQATAELRSAFQESQRSSIRQNKDCNMYVVIPGRSSQNSEIQGSCLAEGKRGLPRGIGTATNVISTDMTQSLMPSHRLIPQNLQVKQTNVLRSATCQLFPRSCPVNLTGQEDSSGSSSSSSSNSMTNAKIQFGSLGAAKFEVIGNQQSNRSVNINDGTAKFISFRHNNLEGRKSCIVLSRSLGLTRIGTYEGSLSPSQITSQGKCRADKWGEQTSS